MTTRRQALQSLGAGAVALTAGGILAPEARGLIMLGGSTASSPGQPFDFYISTAGTGTATGGGTFSNPWPISMLSNATAQGRYAGKRVGLLPGTYSVSSLMGTNESVAALELAGGTGTGAKTYIGSSDSSGNYSRGTATIDGAARATFTANFGASSTATFNISMTGGSNVATLSSVSGTVQAGMQVTGGGAPSPVYLVSGSGTTWTTDYTPPSNWSASGVTGTVATMTVTASGSGTISRGMISVGTGLPAGAMVTSGSGTSWTVGASIASPLTGVAVSGTVYGGDNNNISAIMAARAGCNYWTIDGIEFTGYSMWAFHVGNSPSGGACPISGTIQNCEFTGGNCTYATSANFVNGVNCGVIIVYASVSGLVTNSWFHGNVGNPRDTQHWSWIYQWGLGSTATANNAYKYNTVVSSGNFQGKEATQYNTEIAYNYMDMTGQLATAEYTGAAIFGCMSDGGSASATGTSWHHNVILANVIALDFNNTNPSSSYLTSPLNIYNNTVVFIGKQTDGYANGGYSYSGSGTGSAHHVSAYNNLYYDNGQTISAYGYWLTNVDSFALADYNIYGSWSNAFNTVPSGQNGSSGLTAHTLASWGTAIGGLEANSSTNSTNPFTPGGSLKYADNYRISNTSPAYQNGHVGGTSGGAAVNVGAWDGSVTQIGCNFAV